MRPSATTNFLASLCLTLGACTSSGDGPAKNPSETVTTLSAGGASAANGGASFAGASGDSAVAGESSAAASAGVPSTPGGAAGVSGSPNESGAGAGGVAAAGTESMAGSPNAIGGGGGGDSAGGMSSGGTDAAGGAGGGPDNSAGDSNGGAGMAGMAGSPSAEPGVRIVGRTADGAQGPRFEWPGVSIEARFTGTQVSIELDDAGNENQFEVIIDGERLQKLVTAAGQTTYELASGLSDAEHDLVVWRRTEAYYNATEFLGLTDFGSGGALLAPPPARERRIEVIGDSISVGYGIEGTPECSGTQSNENNYLSYSSVAARLLDADLVTIAWSGIGMYRNYDEEGPSSDAMPARYDFALPTSNTPWDFSQYRPDAVVINLSSNDYSTRGDPGQPYIDAYVEFLHHVRENYPDAYIFCLIQWSTSGPNTETVVATLQNEGDANIEAFDINVDTGENACEGHPDVEKAAAMGQKLADHMRTVLGW